jgi:diadenosine tetraphosphate (Ap4A) HIT family hydrolase
MTSAFALDSRLAASTLPVGDLALCTVRLQNDSRFPWLMLVPRREGVAELTDLADDEYRLLTDEIRLATRVMMELSKPDKVNVAAIGNLVPQMHVHVIGRFRSDPAWPGTVWGFGTRTPYPDHAAAALIERAQGLFAAA